MIDQGTTKLPVYLVEEEGKKLVQTCGGTSLKPSQRYGKASLPSAHPQTQMSVLAFMGPQIQMSWYVLAEEDNSTSSVS